MSITDPIADMLTCIRNANSIGRDVVDVPHSQMKESVLRILREEKFIKQYKILEVKGKKHLRVYLDFTHEGTPRITGLKRVSRPSLRQYANAANIPTVISGLGVAVVSTSHGVMSDNMAREKGVGGEVLCYVW